MVGYEEEIWKGNIRRRYNEKKGRHKKITGSIDGVLTRLEFTDIKLSRCAYWPACPGWLIAEDRSIYPNEIDKDVWQLGYRAANIQALCSVRTFTKLIKRSTTA